jgi:hypothetical protein
MTYDDLVGLLVDASPLDAAPAESPLVGARRVLDTELPRVEAGGLPLVVQLSGGAGQVAGPGALCRRRGLSLAAVTVTVRDLDDLAGNVRRVVVAVDAARGDGALAEEAAVRITLPPEPAAYGWLAAADEVAAAELGLALPLVAGGTPVAADVLAGWIDAALDREIAFAATGGGPAVRSEGHGVLNLLAATAALWNGDGATAATVVLDSREPTTADIATGRRWCQAVEVADPASTVEALLASTSG